MRGISCGIKGLLAGISALLLLTGCGSIGLAREESFESNYETNNETPENIYVSAAEVLVRSVDKEAQMIDFYVLGSADIKTLAYDGTTLINDRYGQPLIVEQLNAGDVAKIAYNSTIGKVGVIQLDPDSWTNSGITKYSISDNGRSLAIGDDVYSIDGNVRVFSGDDEITLEQLIEHDVLSVQGRDRNIVSIRVDSGHGYLELENEFALIGGWIEIGQTLISQVADDMLFTVPEGTYNVRLTNTGVEEYREVTITRNDITELDLSDIVVYMPEKGLVSFDIYPESASTYIDGNYVDTYYSIKLPGGLHEITVSAAGYATVTEYFEVTGLNQTVAIDLEKITETTVSGNTVTVDESGKDDRYIYATITVEAPEGVDLYEDNLYKGIVPVTYQKTPGTHILTVRKDGYVTTSYTIYIEDDGKDVTYALPDMTKDEDSTVSGNSIATATPTPTADPTVSGNTVSGNTVELIVGN